MDVDGVMKIIIAPDSFKHSLSALEACKAISSAAQKAMPDASIVEMPVADGGEGSVDSIIGAMDGEKIAHNVKGPLFEDIESYYGRAGDTAIIEMAAICGLTMLNTPNPEKTSSYGVGEMIKHALADGCESIVLCIGGSGTNDGGIGALTALGGVFYDSGGNTISPVGGNLHKITAIDTNKLIKTPKIKIACDVDNPLYGKNGAAYVFGPQKGADKDMVMRLDTGLRNLAGLLHRHTGADISQTPGCGAAGGIAACFLAYGLAEIISGVDLVLDTIRFDAHLDGADLVITGEGKTDKQTLGGKTIIGVTKRARAKNVPVVVLSGAVEDGIDDMLYGEGITAVFPCIRQTGTFEEIKEKSSDWLYQTALNFFRAVKLNI